MSEDDVIEDEANEREIRRIRRARLAANDDWCDDCHGYTHMPYCPAYEQPASNKHKGDVMRDDRETVPCALCGEPTPMTSTKRCDRCWELESRIKYDPELARRILEQVEKET